MTEAIAELLRNYGIYAALLSISLNILATISGLFPTFFITAANIALFGFWTGTIVSFLGESLGAIAAFLLYRLGFRSSAQTVLNRHPKAKALINAQGREAFQLIFLLRLLPFAPAVVATLGAAIGKTSLLLFATASTLGKVPALLMEAYAVHEIFRFRLSGRIALVLLALWMAFDVWNRLVEKQGEF